MSTLTKVFAVVLVVFCIAFSMSVMQFLVTSSNQRAQRLEAEARAQSAEASAESANLQVAKLNQLLTDERSEHNTTLAQEEQKSRDLAIQLTAAAERAADLSTKLTQSQANADTAIEIAEGAQTLYENSANQNAALRDELSKQVQVASALRDEIRNLERDRNNLAFHTATLRKQVEDLQDQVQELQGRLVSLTRAAGEIGAGRGGPVRGGEISPATGSEPVHGRIKNVTEDLATISVGEDDGVAKGMKFLVYRGDQLLATFIADQVQPDETAGRLVNVQAEVKGGDNVLFNPRVF